MRRNCCFGKGKLIGYPPETNGRCPCPFRKEMTMSKTNSQLKSDLRIDDVTELEQIPNIGPATAGDLRMLGIHRPHQLATQDPMELYTRLCEMTGQCHDPCVIDVFLAVVDFGKGNKPKPWWEFTKVRKSMLAMRKPK